MALRRQTSLGYQTNLLARLFENALRERIAPHGVVPGQFPALLTLYEHDGLTQTELAREVGIEQSTMAKTLQRMERDGLIRRTPDPNDRRRSRIHLTSRARRLHQPLTNAAQRINAAAAQTLTPAQVTTLLATLSQLIANLDPDAIPTASPPR
jgi:DNA-binding MarR family transcriptional regulator